MNLNQYIDHTLLKPEASLWQIEKLCKEAQEYEFFSVCVNPYFVKEAFYFLSGSSVKVCTVVGFPLGTTAMEIKRFEAMKALYEGAQEIDMVLNVSAVKSNQWQQVMDEMASLAQLCHQQKAILKVIFETCLLTEAEKIKACELAVQAKVDFVKTSTGFSSAGATIADVQLMRSIVGPNIGVKASGGIRDTAMAIAMIEAGASRLGTSAGVDIVKGVVGAEASY